jgi:hypothetical protein
MTSDHFARKSEGFGRARARRPWLWELTETFKMRFRRHAKANDGNASHSQASAFEFGLAFFLKGANSFERIASREAQRVHFIFIGEACIDRRGQSASDGRFNRFDRDRTAPCPGRWLQAHAPEGDLAAAEPWSSFDLGRLLRGSVAPGFQLQPDRYAAYAIASGVGPETVAIVRKSVEANSSMVVPERNEQLLAEARFKDSEVFYADMTSRGWIAYA